jgi:transposase
MPKRLYDVKLTAEEREFLAKLISSGEAKARKLTRARILLKADAGYKDEAIKQAIDVSLPTIHRVRKQFVEEGLEAAINRRPPDRIYERRLDGRAEAHLVALTCSKPPAGEARWNLRLLASRLVELEEVDVESVSHETIRRTLKKTNSSLGSRSNG